MPSTSTENYHENAFLKYDNAVSIISSISIPMLSWLNILNEISIWIGYKISSSRYFTQSLLTVFLSLIESYKTFTFYFYNFSNPIQSSGFVFDKIFMKPCAFFYPPKSPSWVKHFYCYRIHLLLNFFIGYLLLLVPYQYDAWIIDCT
jgi:hypothetical protein